MKRFIEGEDRQQVTLLPECLDDFIGEDNPVRVVDAFVEELDLQAWASKGVSRRQTGRPSYHPAVLLKIYIYGYLNRIQSSRRLERESQRNVELMWLDRAAGAGLQDHRGLPARQRRGHPQRVPTLRRAVPASSSSSRKALWPWMAASSRR